MKWDSLRIKSVSSYKTHHKLPAKDRCEVTVDMPVEEYGEFRRMIEAHHLRTRRKDDQK